MIVYIKINLSRYLVFLDILIVQNLNQKIVNFFLLPKNNVKKQQMKRKFSSFDYVKISDINAKKTSK